MGKGSALESVSTLRMRRRTAGCFPETADEFKFRLGNLLYCRKAVLPGERESESSEELSDADRAYAWKLDSDAAQGPCRFGDRESE